MLAVCRRPAVRGSAAPSRRDRLLECPCSARSWRGACMTTPEFQGVIGRYRRESTPWWPEPVRPPAGAPHVLIVVLDDVGFAQLGCFGSDIETPVLDGLAAGGLRYTQLHTTPPCSPTRAPP